MNKDIEKWEKKKWENENPQKAQQIKEEKKFKKNIYYFIVIPLAILNNYFGGPVYVYLIIGTLPYFIKKYKEIE